MGKVPYMYDYRFSPLSEYNLLSWVSNVLYVTNIRTSTGLRSESYLCGFQDRSNNPEVDERWVRPSFHELGDHLNLPSQYSHMKCCVAIQILHTVSVTIIIQYGLWIFPALGIWFNDATIDWYFNRCIDALIRLIHRPSVFFSLVADA